MKERVETLVRLKLLEYELGQARGQYPKVVGLKRDVQQRLVDLETKMRVDRRDRK